MSGVVDSGRESGHGNIDANDPELKNTDFFARLWQAYSYPAAFHGTSVIKDV
jgi:hypothetical protein